jgi:hypothetical protein
MKKGAFIDVEVQGATVENPLMHVPRLYATNKIP